MEIASIDPQPRTRFTARLFPQRCIGCGAAQEPVCRACLHTLHAAPPLRPPPSIEAWTAPFRYDGVVRELIARAKYRNQRYALDWLANAVARQCQATKFPPINCVTWAPTTHTRRESRGFDHAELLARRVARELQLPVAPTLRRLDAAPQTGRPRTQRLIGPVFDATHIEVTRRDQRTVLIVDDVATTGVSLSNAATVLRRSGYGPVFAATIARTPPSKNKFV